MKYNVCQIAFQILLFVHFLGTNGQYHLMRDAKGPSTHTVFRTVHQVAAAIGTLKQEIIRWPQVFPKRPLDQF